MSLCKMSLQRSLYRYVFVILLALLFFFPFESGAETAETGYVSQTIMVYMVGTDLESGSGAATRDIAEMLKARANPEQVRVIVLTGGARSWISPVIPVDQLTVFEIKGNRPQNMHSFPLASMGNPATLTAFLDYGVANYPAESYGLILWNHGGGPMVGFGMDELHQGDGLTLAELHQALDDSVFGKQMTLEWIGFDACLMSTAEVAFIVAGYARYMIASQETLPNEGMNYLFLKDASASSLTGPEVAETIINRTFEYYDQKARNQPDRAFDLTLSCLDLAKLPALENTINELFEDMEGMLEDGKYNALAQQRSDVKAFGLSNTDQSFDLIDLVDLAQIMSLIYPERCEALVAAIQDMIVMNRTNQEDASGISIYYPYRNKNHYSKQWQKAYANLGFAAKYTN